MHNESFYYKRASIEDLRAQKDNTCALLSEVLLLSFPNIKHVNKQATEIYERILRYIDDGTAIVFCACDESTIIGLIWAYIREQITGDRVCHVDEFVVGEKYRGRGIGGKLLNCVEEEASKLKVKRLELNVSMSSKDAVNFYVRKGFSIKRLNMERDITNDK